MSVAALITLHLRIQSRYWRSRSLRSRSQIPKQSPMNLWWILSILKDQIFVLKNRNPTTVLNAIESSMPNAWKVLKESTDIEC
ncbi:unnamed protein product [Sphagnum compactum]